MDRQDKIKTADIKVSALHFWFVIIGLMLIQGCIQRDKVSDCRRFRNGKFVLTLKPDNRSYIITRSDTAQFEYDEKLDTITVLKIKWTGPCEYEAIRDFKAKKHEQPGLPHPILRYINDPPLKVKIIGTGRDFYVFEAREDSDDFVYRDTLWIFK